MTAQARATDSDWLLSFPPPRSLPLDQEALRVFERAYHIGLAVEKSSDPPITFSTVLIALLTADNETSGWFARLAVANGPQIEAVCSEKGTSLVKIAAVNVINGRPATPRLSDDGQLLTISAKAVLGTAEEWAQRVNGSDIGVRHLVASYVLNPPTAHRRQLNTWGFNERAWRSTFFEWVGTRYTAESWTDARNKVAPTKAVASFEQATVKGVELATLTVADALTTKVLQRAAEYHARRSDRWLRLQTVFFALVDTAREDVAIGAALAPLRDDVQTVDARYRAAEQAFLSGAEQGRPVVAFDGLDISPRALNGLETARELAGVARQEGGKIGVLHLAGALVSRRVDSDEELAALGLDPNALRLKLIRQATEAGESNEFWREALGEEEARTASGRPADLNSDEPDAVVRADEGWTNDPLGIRPDVASFASLLASKSLEPPLSIGLFGPWGSGKTTFLRRLRRVIDQRAEQAAQADAAAEPTPYVRHIVHVEFNAWHFAEDALISSLVDTIVRELKAFIKDDYPTVGQALADLRAETADSARRKVELARKAEEEARKTVATAADALAKDEREARAKAASLQHCVEAVWDSVRVEVANSKEVKESQILERLSDTVKGVDDLKAQLASIRGRPVGMLAALGWPRTLLFAAIVLALPPAMVWLVRRLVSIGQVGEIMTLVSGMLSAGGVWLRTATGAATKVDAAIAKVTTEYEKRIRNDPAVRQAESALAVAAEQARGAADKLAAAERDLRSAEAGAAAATLPAQMLQLAERRKSDMTYAKELTTISIARGDLQLLSTILRDQAAHGAGSSATLRPVDRVILYIDDLDRCKPEDVVRVLQMVHMLLAFELFVVVVAVDARWVEESLKHNYQWLAGDATTRAGAANGANARQNEQRSLVTPQDYLEKIFQISFWLTPLTSARAAEFMKSLVRTGPRADGTVVGGASSASVTEPKAGARVGIEPIELDYMCALAAYVGPSPRRVKRLVNAYRLLKARLSDAQLDSFLADRQTEEGGVRSGPYQLVIALLAIGTGVPESASEILADLAERDPKDELRACIASFRERDRPDWTMAAQVLETLMRTQKPKGMSELRGWARNVGRFLLRGPAESGAAGSAIP